MNNALCTLIAFILTTSGVALADSAVVLTGKLKPGDTLQLLKKPGADFKSPHSKGWDTAGERGIDLSMAPPVHASINLLYDPASAPVSVFAQAATDGERLYLKMRWSDTTQDTATTREQFSDGAAVQFALDGGASTSYMMGTAATPVNIWYWKAGVQEPQNLAAGGFGSTTKMPKGQLEAKSRYNNGEWVVVFSRPLSQHGEHQVDLNKDEILVAFALWQGQTKQRDGLKHVSPGWVTIR
jgi:dimethylsulfide dehydrogenase subunit gamma